MSNYLIVKKKLNSFKKKITVSGDKSISIRWVLFSSLSNGVCNAKNLLISEDVIAAINAVKKLGIKVLLNKDNCKIFGKGINGYKYKKNLKIDAQNSGTLGRLICGLLINTPNKIRIVGDKSLSKRDFKRIADPLSKFGAKFKLKKNKNLPLTILGSSNLKSISYRENKGSAQCKSSVIFAGMRSNGTTIIKANKSRNHTELLSKYLKLPITIKNKKNYDEIRVKKVKILKEMGIAISYNNLRLYKGEKISDINIKSPKLIKPINCPSKLNSGAIDEFLIIFLVAAKANGISYFKDLSELNQKESPRLKWGAYILNQMGIKTIVTKDSIKIFGNPKLKLNKKISIKNFLKDHRVFMTSVIAALSFGGEWKIHDKDSIKSSFPNFLKILNQLRN